MPPGARTQGTLCPACRAELLEQPKEFLLDMLGHVTGVNAIAMAAVRDSVNLSSRRRAVIWQLLRRSNQLPNACQ